MVGTGMMYCNKERRKVVCQVKEKKGIVLVIVMGALVVISALALIALIFFTQRARMTLRKATKAKLKFAAYAGVVDALEKLRRGAVTFPTLGSPTSYTLPEKINGYNVEVTIKIKGDTSSPFPCPTTVPSDYCVFSTVY